MKIDRISRESDSTSEFLEDLFDKRFIFYILTHRRPNLSRVCRQETTVTGHVAITNLKNTYSLFRLVEFDDRLIRITNASLQFIQKKKKNKKWQLFITQLVYYTKDWLMKEFPNGRNAW